VSHRYALLIDGGFFFRKLRNRLKRPPKVDDVLTEIGRMRECDALKDFELLRVYYYDAEPATGTIKHPLTKETINLAETPIYTANKAFLQSLELQPDISLRLGELAPRGYRLDSHTLKDKDLTKDRLSASDFKPDLEQKGVDLRIGLDIARLSLRNMVSTIVVCTGDSDFIPAFKFARREGVRVLLAHMGHGVKRELKAHTDGYID